ncbi:hypothetical protein N7462_008611 [Penicillium macrosclerotiorum]|uniref:uncharacterized protein n=1 Tax=Penicillium macrosclerotiorum TaxID=303699 RepID=UPI002547521C|nr:uncharacterized protein N7462_008611 [Penicillium macrosclerotiorum]KAJ5675714.1 hypothetical protein N7462_008611 [Penicillium macrosclerotiorum]
MSFLKATLIVAALSPAVAALAFDGAVGFGSIATGGSGGTTVTVTTLADSGTGSFREAVSKSNRIIEFSVSGYIELESAISLSSDLTINGQTAPGNGIGIMGAEVSASDKSNIIIRNLRMRQGTLDSDTGHSAFNMGDASNVILDHCSIEYGQWDSIDAVGAVNITVSNSIIAVPIGQQFGAHVETGPSTFYRNLWVSAHNRQPLSKDDTQYINNVVYNYQAAYTSANTGGYFSHDIIGNYFITGPSTTTAKNAFYQMNAKQSVYASGNYLDDNEDGELNGSSYNSVGSATVLSEPWASDSSSLATLSAEEAVAYVLSNAGATPRDELDTYVVGLVESYGTKGALYKSQDDTGVSNGGYGTL